MASFLKSFNLCNKYAPYEFKQVQEASIFTSVGKNSNRYQIYLWKTSRFARLFCLLYKRKAGQDGKWYMFSYSKKE